LEKTSFSENLSKKALFGKDNAVSGVLEFFAPAIVAVLRVILCASAAEFD
jgi:hypothetical protein